MWALLRSLYHELTNPRYRALHPASQDIRSLMSPEKQMSACSHLFFLEAHYIISYPAPDLQTVSGNTKQLENAHGYSILYNRKNVLYVPAE